MKELYLAGILASLYILSLSLGKADGSNRQAGIQMSVSVNTNRDNSTAVNGSSSASGAHTNVGVWRPRGHIRGRRPSPGPDIGPSGPRYVARGSRRRPEYVRRIAQRMRNRRLNRNRQNGIGNSGSGLVVSGSHSISSQDRTGLDPFLALQRGHRRQGAPFQDRRTAYDFLSNGGNSFRARTRQQEERRTENAQMASVMCGVFGKQFIPSAIGGRCVDPQ